MSEVQPAQRTTASLREFLTWVARAERTYDEAMTAWGSHCPRFTVWEDALGDGVVEILGGCGESISGARLQLTPRGRALLSQT